jgi:hypothetical protein
VICAQDGRAILPAAGRSCKRRSRFGRPLFVRPHRRFRNDPRIPRASLPGRAPRVTRYRSPASQQRY